MYELSVKLDYQQRTAGVQQKITYPNLSSNPLDHLLLIVEPSLYAGVFHLNRVFLEGEGLLENYTLEQDRLTVLLPRPLEPESALVLELSYELILPPIPPPAGGEKPQPFGFTAGQLNLVDWYPYVPPRSDQGDWVANPPWFFGEHQVYEAADFQVELELVSPPAGLVLAASSEPVVEGSIHKFSHLHARNFALSASHLYQVLEQEVDGILVFVYVFPGDETAGQAALEDTARAVQVFSRVFGSYPRSSLSVVAADFLDGMEYDGLFFLNRAFFQHYAGTPRSYLTIISVHETAHQWWYGLVGNDQAIEPWLDESLCTFSELLFYEEVYPEMVDWWWGFRVHPYQPRGKIGSPIYAYSGAREYRDAVYLHGAVFLSEVRSTVGADTFAQFLQAYAARHAFQVADGNSFLSLLREFASDDLDFLIQKYIY
jgi:hypothetical protein